MVRSYKQIHANFQIQCRVVIHKLSIILPLHSDNGNTE